MTNSIKLFKLTIKSGVKLFTLCDSCFSGTVLDLKYNYLDSSNFNNLTVNTKIGETLGQVIMISGCMDSQTSAEALIQNIAQGALTWSFIDCINKTPNCSWRELLKLMRNSLKSNGFTQIPQLSTAYEIWLARHPEPRFAPRLANSRELESMYDMLTETLVKIDFIDRQNPDYWMMNVRRLFNRHGLRAREAQVVKGICRQIDWYVRRRLAEKKPDR